MRKKSLQIIVAAMTLAAMCAPASAAPEYTEHCATTSEGDILLQDYVDLTYSDTYGGSDGNNYNFPVLPKAQRVSRYATSFVITSDIELDEQMLKAVDYAVSVWESYIVDCEDIYIKIEMASIEEDIRTIVRYERMDGILIPTSLKTFMERPLNRDTTYPDGVIVINSDTSWDYCLGDNISVEGKNLAFGIMRAIARIMGFGSSVLIDDDGYRFADKRYHTAFNRLASNSANKYLDSFSVNKGMPSQELKAYIESPGQLFWVNADGSRYQLLSPPYTKDSPPFVFLEDKSTLMRGDLQSGNYILHVDETTQNILNSLGWNTRSPTLIKITSDDVPDTGLASAYESHRFKVDKGNLSITDPKWELTLPLSEGGKQIIQLEDDNLSCRTIPIDDESIYKVNSDGDIEARLQFYCTVNGKNAVTAYFKLYLELKPLIEYAIIEKIADNSPYVSYDAYYRVKYRGTDRIKISVEEEYGSRLKTWHIHEPYIAQGVADHITAPYYAWIDFIAENKYGRSIYTIELQPYGIVSQNYGNNLRTVSGMRLTAVDVGNTDDRFEVYSVSGIKIGSFARQSDIGSISHKGLLIVKRIHNNEVLGIQKIIKK